jgi:predicted CxxxxCH...CXXCH cytochrome family protein
MRRNCLLVLVMTLLLAVLPVAAHAWTLTLKVTGGSLAQGNTVVLSGGTVKTVANGNVTVYPSSATTVTVNTASGSTSLVTLDGMAAPASFSLSSGSHTVTVSYSAPTASTLSIISSAGGAAYVLLPNNTWTSSGAAGLVTGTILNYSISADANHVISAYTLPGAAGSGNGTKGQSITGTFTLGSGNNAITANFGFAPTVTGSLSTPTNGFTSQPVNCTATASSNDTGLLYAFKVTGPANFSRLASPLQTFTFTPTLQGSYAVTATVTSANGGSFTSEAATVVVTSYQEGLNNQCISCHSTQSPTIVSDYQASVLHTQSPASTCGSCHTPDAPHSAGINAANVDPVNFQVKGDGVTGVALGASFCIKCHDANIDAAFTASQHKTRLLTCSSCHTKGVHNVDFTTTPVRPFAGDSYLNRDLGISNVCMTCHSGANNGTSIAVKVGVADFDNLPFVAPSEGSAGGTLHGKVGYHFPGQSYAFYSSNTHRGIGIANNSATGSAGPCTACHKTPESGHSFQAAVTAGGVCSNCHGNVLTAADLSQDKADFSNGLDVFKAMLNAKGFAYSEIPPYFSNTDWGPGQAGASTMGSAFNYALLLQEPGAYVHNGAYAKKLIFDSIDYLYNGSVTGNLDSALSYLVARGAIAQGAADGLVSYKAKTGCTVCHSFSAGSSASHATHQAAGVLCSGCHSKTATSATALVPATTVHANGVVNVDFAPWAPGSYSGGKAGTCSNVSCHSNGLGSAQNMVWGSTAPLTCKSCHPVLGGAHAAHIGNLQDSAAFYSYTGNYSTGSMYRFGCSNCHPTDSASHMQGRIALALARDPQAGTLRNLNDANTANTGINSTGSGITGTSGTSVVCSVVYCHSNGYQAAPVYAVTPNWYGGHLDNRSAGYCASCHGNSPNTTVAGSPAHSVHVVGIHALNVFSGTLGNLPAGAAGNVGHGVAAQSSTINCNTCHNGTVISSRNDGGNACSSCHTGQGNYAQIADKSLHINGSVNIAFANMSIVTKAQLRPASFAAYSGSVWTRNGGNYKNGAAAFDTSKNALRSAATWDGAGNCSNVACHMGVPVQWSNTNAPSYCALCHTAL